MPGTRADRESAAPARGGFAGARTKRGDPADAAVDAALLQQIGGTCREAGGGRPLGAQPDPPVAVGCLVGHLVEALRPVAAPWPEQRRPNDPSRVRVPNPCFHRPITPAAASMTYLPNARSARCRPQENGKIGPAGCPVCAPSMRRRSGAPPNDGGGRDGAPRMSGLSRVSHCSLLPPVSLVHPTPGGSARRGAGNACRVRSADLVGGQEDGDVVRDERGHGQAVEDLVEPEPAR
jgi:hypothetical protein